MDAARRRGNSRLPQLLDEAARAFAARGFGAASVREIVGPIGMLPGSLYCHFATKEALLVAVYTEGVARISAAVDAAVAPLAEPWARLEAACVAHLASLLDQTDYSQVVIRVRPSDAPTVAAELVALRDAYEKRWAGLVAALPLDRSVSRSDLRLFLMGALNWSQTWYRDDGASTPAKIARRFVGLLRSGLAEKTKESA
jgi:AcrR family transcriptional regulator